MSGSTASAWGARSAASAGPVSTPTTCIPAARPAARSCRLSPTITTSAGDRPVAEAKARSGAGSGFAPWPLSAPATKSKASAIPAVSRCASAESAASFVITPRRSPIPRSLCMRGASGTAGARGASAARAASQGSIASAEASGSAAATSSATSRLLPAITGLSRRKRRRPRS